MKTDERNAAARVLAACAIGLLSASAAAGADFDYRVEYVKSTHGSCVKTDLVPQPGTTFRMDVRFDSPYNQIFGGKFDHTKNTTVFFGQEDAKDAEGFRDLFQLALGGHEAQTYQTFASLGRKSREKWIHCGLQEVNDSVIGCRVPIVYDGRHVTWGSFDMKLEGERTAAGKVPVSFFGMTCDDGSVKSYACYDLALYGAAFYRDGKPLARFVPVVKDGVAGLYEAVSRKFYASATDVPLVEFALALRDVAPDSIPVNFLHPVEGTPLGARGVPDPERAVDAVAILRLANPATPLRFAGGRRDLSDETAAACIHAGMDAGIAGPLLTTPGADFDDDRALAAAAGYHVTPRKDRPA